MNYIIIHPGLEVFVSLINFLLSATDFHFIEIDLDQRPHMETGYFFKCDLNLYMLVHGLSCGKNSSVHLLLPWKERILKM